MPLDDGMDEKNDEEENGVGWGWNMPPFRIGKEERVEIGSKFKM
jgi:hypothetical protein